MGIDIAGVNTPGNGNRFIGEERKKHTSAAQEWFVIIIYCLWESRHNLCDDLSFTSSPFQKRFGHGYLDVVLNVILLNVILLNVILLNHFQFYMETLNYGDIKTHKNK